MTLAILSSLQVRSWKTTLLQLLAPLFFLLLVTGLSYLPQGLENILDPPVTPLGILPRCKVRLCEIGEEELERGGSVCVCDEVIASYCIMLLFYRPGMESLASLSLPLDL